jgi:hypothetical protein
MDVNKALAKSAVCANADLTLPQQRWMCQLIDGLDLSPAAPAFAFTAPDMPAECCLTANSWLMAALPASANPYRRVE